MDFKFFGLNVFFTPKKTKIFGTKKIWGKKFVQKFVVVQVLFSYLLLHVFLNCLCADWLTNWVYQSHLTTNDFCPHKQFLKFSNFSWLTFLKNQLILNFFGGASRFLIFVEIMFLLANLAFFFILLPFSGEQSEISHTIWLHIVLISWNND